MSFGVEPAALDTFAHSIEALAGDAKKAKSCVQTHQKAVDDKSGPLVGAIYTHFVLNLGDAVQKNIDRLDGLSAGSAKELRKSAEVYRHTEKKNAERIDQAYPK